MPKRAKYCYCKNTYTIKRCNGKKCKSHPIWSQGIGYIGGKGEGEAFKKRVLLDSGVYEFNLCNKAFYGEHEVYSDAGFRISG